MILTLLRPRLFKALRRLVAAALITSRVTVQAVHWPVFVVDAACLMQTRDLEGFAGVEELIAELDSNNGSVVKKLSARGIIHWGQVSSAQASIRHSPALRIGLAGTIAVDAIAGRIGPSRAMARAQPEWVAANSIDAGSVDQGARILGPAMVKRIPRVGAVLPAGRSGKAEHGIVEQSHDDLQSQALRFP